jgi:hypothetical protein
VSKLSDLEDTLDAVREELAEVQKDRDDIVSAIAAEHEEHHTGAYRWCERVACRQVNRGDEW